MLIPTTTFGKTKSVDQYIIFRIQFIPYEDTPTKDKVSHLAQASILSPFPSFYAPYSFFAFPFPFLRSTFLFVGVIPCALGAIPLVPWRYHPSLSSRYSCVFGTIPLVPWHNCHSWRSLSYHGTISRIWDVSFSLVLPFFVFFRVSRSRCIPHNFLA